MSERIAVRLALGVAALAAVALIAGLALTPVTEWLFLLPVSVSFVAVGALLAARRRHNPIGWLFLAFGLVAALDFAAWSYAERALERDPGSLPGGDIAASLAGHLWHPSFGFFVLSFLLFPNGHLLSRRWRWVAGLVVFTYTGLALSGPFDDEFVKDLFPRAEPLFHGTAAEIGTAVFSGLLAFNLVLLVVSGASLLVRLRRVRGEEREQVKVFVYTVAFVMFAFPVGLLIVGDGSLGVVLFPLIPASAGVAILRYRLYDIDVVINRTLVYGALTATLGAAYLGSVLLLQLVLSPGSDLAIAGSTLAVAALFRPARSRIQAIVDRRFYRRRYDARRTLEAFGGRLRDEVELAALAGELRSVVRETMQPAHVSVWLREPEEAA